MKCQVLQNLGKLMHCIETIACGISRSVLFLELRCFVQWILVAEVIVFIWFARICILVHCICQIELIFEVSRFLILMWCIWSDEVYIGWNFKVHYLRFIWTFFQHMHYVPSEHLDSCLDICQSQNKIWLLASKGFVQCLCRQFLVHKYWE